MKTKELIKKLKEIDETGNKEVYLVTDCNDGCETCGWGSTMDEEESFEVTDIESKIWIKKY